jgi:hypothetical protein
MQPIPATTATSPSTPSQVGDSRSRTKAPIEDINGPVPRAIG